MTTYKIDASIASSASGAVASYITAAGDRKSAEITARASNNIRAINNVTAGVVNERDKALTALQRWAQDVRNSRVYEQVASYQEALAMNFNRQRDLKTRANFAENIREAEESGRMQAQAAASGITGSVVDIIDQTVQLRNGMKERARIDAENQGLDDYNERELDQRLALLDNLDHTLIFDAMPKLDYGTTNERSTANPFSAAAASFGIKGLQAVGDSVNSFFKFPDNGLGGLASSGSRSMGD